MSTFAYAALTSRREKSTSGTSTTTSAPGVRTYVDTLAALVPAEVIGAHVVILAITTEPTTGADGSLPVIMDKALLRFSFWALVGMAAFLYVAGRWSNLERMDFLRVLIPPIAFVGWTLIQSPSAFDALGSELSKDARDVIAILGAVPLAALAAALAYKADQTPPKAPGSRPRAVTGDPTKWATVGFQPRGAVRWFNPVGLASTGLQMLLAGVFGKYADKRELEEGFPKRWCDETRLLNHAGPNGVWADFAADVGDGFAPTYSIAWLISRDKLVVTSDSGARHSVPRGDLLVLGGDEVYPFPSETAYRDRLIGPYELASSDVTSKPSVYAVPGNHDWYDGLTSFMRVFQAEKTIGAWQTRQPRSYFAVRLPYGWWLWGLDIAFDWYIDRPQEKYFERAARELDPDSNVIIVTPMPSWIRPAITGDFSYKARLSASRNLSLIEELVLGRGAHVPLIVSGDLHHYSRYQNERGRHLVVCGGGGAFLYPTHRLAKNVQWPADSDEPTASFERLSTFPGKSASEARIWQTLKLPIKNWRFPWAMASVYAAIAFATKGLLVAGPRSGGEDYSLSLGGVASGMVRTPRTFLLLLVLAGLLFVFADGRSVLGKLLMGGLHLLTHAAAVGVALLVSGHLFHGIDFHLGRTLLVVGVAAAVGWLIGSMIVAVYLSISFAWFGRHPNEAFSAQRIEDYKSFLRLHFRPDGSLKAFVIGLVTTPGWERRSVGEGDWQVRLKAEPSAELIDEFEVPSRSRGETGN